MGDISFLQIVVIAFISVIVWDAVRLLALKLLSKRIRIFSIVPDTDQTRLTYVSEKLGIPVTNIVVTENADKETVYYDVNNSDLEYTIKCVPSYVLSLAGETEPIELEEVKETTIVEENADNQEIDFDLD